MFLMCHQPLFTPLLSQNRELSKLFYPFWPNLVCYLPFLGHFYHIFHHFCAQNNLCAKRPEKNLHRLPQKKVPFLHVFAPKTSFCPKNPTFSPIWPIFPMFLMWNQPHFDPTFDQKTWVKQVILPKFWPDFSMLFAIFRPFLAHFSHIFVHPEITWPPREKRPEKNPWPQIAPKKSYLFLHVFAPKTLISSPKTPILGQFGPFSLCFWCEMTQLIFHPVFDPET